MPPRVLYWSHVKNFSECPQKYLFSKGCPGLDLGGGEGNPKPVTKPSSEHHPIMGDVIQYAVECFYKKQFWRDPGSVSSKMLTEAGWFFDNQIVERYVDWSRSPTREELWITCKQGILGFLKTMKQNRLLGLEAKAEETLVGFFDSNLGVGGRVDMMFRREEEGVTILDGKNSKHKGKYTDSDQLRWYALCYYLRFGRIPDRLGFVYYRFPYGSEYEGEIQTGVEWVSCDRSDLERLASLAKQVDQKIREQSFPANPEPSVCRFCKWEFDCEERFLYKKEKRDSQEMSVLEKMLQNGSSFEMGSKE